ncbi:MAG: phosphatase PAP2 family protein [Gemmatimonadota bacterium]|nr:phosphatase PAP2 family protein [Gemmatimonadota bacterium]
MTDRLRALAATPHARPVDLLAASYLAATGLIAGLSLSSTGLMIAGLHVVALVLVHALGRVSVPVNRPLAFLRLVWPVAITPLLYLELATLNQLLFPGYFDATVQAWEQALFGSQLSIVMSGWYDALWFSEMLHFGYVSYYVVVPAALIGGFSLGGEDGLERVAFTTALAFFLCYLCFAVFPVAGPRYEFARIVGPQTDGAVFGLVHSILESGSSKGTAFPSSHVAATVSAWLAAGLVDRRLMWILAPFAVSLTMGTVYGRFHYGIDTAVGLGVAMLAVAWTPRLMARLRPARPT